MPTKSTTNKNEKTMKYQCIKSDPLRWIKTGKVYNIRRMGHNYYVEGEGLAVSESNMKEMFKPIVPR